MPSWWRLHGRGRSGHGALHAIPGIGRKRAERYGKDRLAITGENAAAAAAPAAEPAPSEGVE